MSFKIMMIGIGAIFLTFIMAALLMMQLMPVQFFVVGSILVSMISGLTIVLVNVMANGIVGPMLSARVGGKTVLLNITAGKSIEFISGNESEGMIETDKGYFHVLPDAIYTLPNGVRTAITYFKYAVTLPKEFLITASNLKKAGVRDFNTLQVINKQAAAQNQEIFSS